jgi:hypothetical protein
MSTSTKLRRVRFRRWTDHAIDLPAPTGQDALAHARALYGQHGTAMFDDLDCGEEDWHVEDDRSVIAGEFGWVLREIEEARYERAS